MPADEKPKADEPKVDEHHMREWFDFGFAEMHIYLVKHAEFAKWLDRHPQAEEPPDGSTRTP